MSAQKKPSIKWNAPSHKVQPCVNQITTQAHQPICDNESITGGARCREKVTPSVRDQIVPIEIAVGRHLRKYQDVQLQLHAPLRGLLPKAQSFSIFLLPKHPREE